MKEVKGTLVRCPNCGHVFDSDETFSWGLDDDGDPTIEELYCPVCGIATWQQFDCSRCVGSCQGKYQCNLEEQCSASAVVSFDEFEPVEEDTSKEQK